MSAKEAGTGSRDRWDKIGLFIGPAQALILAILAYALTGRVTNAIERGKLDLANVHEMRELILDLKQAQSTPDSLAASAGALAMFGRYAIVPFLDLLQTGESNQRVAAQNGLRAVALLDAKAMKREMRRIVRNRSGLYTWRAHKAAISLLGGLEDIDAIADLENYLALVSHASADSSLRNLQLITSSDDPPEKFQLGQIQTELKQALRTLRR